MRQRRDTVGWAIMAVLAVGLGACLWHLFALRFHVGEGYAPYSSFRTDPFGTRVLFDSLRRMPGMQVERNLDPLWKGDSLWPATVVLAGVEPYAMDMPMDDAERRLWGTLFARGGRLVVTLASTDMRTSTNAAGCSACATNAAGIKHAPTNAPPLARQGKSRKKRNELRDRSAAEEWGAHVAYSRPAKGTFPATGRAEAAPETFPRSIPIYTTAVFTNVAPEWTVLYRRDGMPVLVERRVGRGSVVLCADSYMVTNEGLSREAGAPLLAWLVGSQRRVVFEETHLGIGYRPGFMTTVRHLGLQGLFIGLLVLGLLYLWKEASPIVSVPAVPLEAIALSGRDSLSGLVNLLRRNLEPATALRHAVALWERTAGRAVSARRRELVHGRLNNVKDGMTMDNAIREYEAMRKIVQERT